MVPEIVKYDIYEGLGDSSITNYLKNREIAGVRIVVMDAGIRVVYTIEMTEEETSFIVLSIPNIIIKKCEAKVNS